jgi:FMN phosphatase YigB (HAD superfamily)
MSQCAVIFDRDNTLTKLDSAVIAARNTRYAAIAPELPTSAIMAHLTSWPGPWPRSEHQEPEFWWTFWRTLAEQHAIATTLVHTLQAVSMTYYTAFAAFPDALDCVHALRSQGLRLAVLTNFQLPSVGQTLRHAGIDPSWFTALFSSGMLGYSKPDPRAYLAVAAALDLSPSACVFVDDLLANVEGACAVGMRGVWLDRQGLAIQPPVERIADLRDLVRLIVGRPVDETNLANIAQAAGGTTYAVPALR